MTVLLAIAGRVRLFLDTLQTSPSLVILILVACSLLVVIYAYQPPLPETAAIAFAPWIISGAILTVLASSLEYPTFLQPIVAGPSAYLTTLAVPGLAWTAMLNLSASPREVPAYHHYIGAMGIGAMVVLSALFVVHVSISSLSQILILLFVPILAFLATGPIAFSIAYWSPDFVVNTRIMGSFVIFGWLLNGISTTTSFAITGAEGHTAFSLYFSEIVIAIAPQGLGGIEPTLLWVWLFLLANMAIGIHVATQLAPYANSDPQTVHAMQGIVGLVGFSLGFNSLFHLVGA